jgi:Fe-S-cluster containining protein
MDAHGLPGVKLDHQSNSKACQFLTEEGCGVYQDRPSACRYYALGTVSMRKKAAANEENFYFVVKEDHCLGHNEPKTQMVREYRHEQGVDDYDELNAEWRQVVLKKRSCGPTLGKPSSRSLDFFYLSSYDVDGLREFLKSPGFSETYDIDEPFMRQLLNDEVILMKFGFRLLKQVLFGEATIPLKPDALEKRIARRRAEQPIS